MSDATPRRVGARRKVGGAAEMKVGNDSNSDVAALGVTEDAQEDASDGDEAASFFGSQEEGARTLPSAVQEDVEPGEAQVEECGSQESVNNALLSRSSTNLVAALRTRISKLTDANADLVRRLEMTNDELVVTKVDNGQVSEAAHRNYKRSLEFENTASNLKYQLAAAENRLASNMEAEVKNVSRLEHRELSLKKALAREKAAKDVAEANAKILWNNIQEGKPRKHGSPAVTRSAKCLLCDNTSITNAMCSACMPDAIV